MPAPRTRRPSSGRDDDIPWRVWLWARDRNVLQPRLCERANDVKRCAAREDVFRHSHAIHPLFRKEAYGNPAPRFEHAMDLGRTGLE